MDPYELLDRSAAEFGARLRVVGPLQWSLPTPCDDWDVRGLVNHVVGGALHYTMLLHGATADEVAATRSADHLGDDPVGAFDHRAREVAAAFREQGALARTVRHPAGDRSAEDLLAMRVMEFAVHAWDLARAIGADEQIDQDVMAALWDRLANVGTGLEQGSYFQPPPPAPPSGDASAQARVLHRLGRHP